MPTAQWTRGWYYYYTSWRLRFSLIQDSRYHGSAYIAAIKNNGPLYCSVSCFIPFLVGLLLVIPLKPKLASTVLGPWFHNTNDQRYQQWRSRCLHGTVVMRWIVLIWGPGPISGVVNSFFFETHFHLVWLFQAICHDADTLSQTHVTWVTRLRPVKWTRDMRHQGFPSWACTWLRDVRTRKSCEGQIWDGHFDAWLDENLNRVR